MTRHLARTCIRSLPALLLASLVACGGGGAADSPAPVAPPPAAPAPPGNTPPPTLAAMVDSFGRPVTEADFGQGNPQAAGIDGTVASGAPLASVVVSVIDSQGRTATATTDDAGYYRLRAEALVPPVVASVTAADGRRWRAVSAQALRTRGFVTLNVTPLTEKLASDLAAAAGLAPGAVLTPAHVGANPAALAAARAALLGLLRPLLAEIGWPEAGFDPVHQPFPADHAGLDLLLDRLQFVRAADGTLAVTPTFPLAGRVEGLGQAGGLQLANAGAVVDVIPVHQDRFQFPARVPAGTAYVVSVVAQPQGLACSVERGAGVMQGAVDDVLVRCSVPQAATVVLAGTVSGLEAGGLSLGTNGQAIEVPAGATAFQFPTPLPVGTPYQLVANQPLDSTCTIERASGRAGIDPPPVVQCQRHLVLPTTVSIGGTVDGLGNAAGLVLWVRQTANGFPGTWAHTIAIAPGSARWSSEPIPRSAFELPVGDQPTVRIAQQPVGLSCTTRRASAPPAGEVHVVCVLPPDFTGAVNGLTGGPLEVAIESWDCFDSFTPMCFPRTWFATVPVGAASYAITSAVGQLHVDWNYRVYIRTQPPGQTCRVTANATGIVPFAGVYAPISCSPL